MTPPDIDPTEDAPPADPAGEGQRFTWRHLAACRGQPVAWWFPGSPLTSEDIAGLRRAEALCAACPVTIECLCDALDNREAFGLWGGLTPKPRTRLRQRIDAWAGQHRWHLGEPMASPMSTAGTAA